MAKAQEPQPSDLFTLARLRAALLKLAGTEETAPESAADAAPALAAALTIAAPATLSAPSDYAVYTRDFDEVVRAEQMATPAELSALHAELVGEIERLGATHDGWVRPWAKKIASRARECACPSALRDAIVTDRAVIPPKVAADLRPIIGKYLQ